MNDPKNNQLATTEKPQNPVVKYFEREEILARFKGILGSRGAQRFVASVLSAILQSDKLQQCDPVSVYVAAIQSATLGLSVDPQTMEAYLVPYKEKATLIVSYRGYRELALRTNRYDDANVVPVYEGDEVTEDVQTGRVDIRGATGFKRVIYSAEKKDVQRKVVGYVAYLKLKNGFFKNLFMSLDDIDAHAKAYSPTWDKAKKQWYPGSLWNNPLERPKMEEKTVFRCLLRKWGSFSPAITKTLEETEGNEQGDIIEGSIRDVPPDEVRRSAEQNIAELTGKSNPDPVPAQRRKDYDALCRRAKKLRIEYKEIIDWSRIVSGDFEHEYTDLLMRVTDAERQEASTGA